MNPESDARCWHINCTSSESPPNTFTLANKYILWCQSVLPKTWRQPQEVRKHHIDKLHWRTCKGDCKLFLNRSVTHQLSLIVVDVVDGFFPGSVPHSFPECGGSGINPQRRHRLASRYHQFVPETPDSVSCKFSSVCSRSLLLLVASTVLFCWPVPIGTTAGERQRRGPVPIGTPEDFPSSTDNTDTNDKLYLQINAHNKSCPCPSCLAKIPSTPRQLRRCMLWVNFVHKQPQWIHAANRMSKRAVVITPSQIKFLSQLFHDFDSLSRIPSITHRHATQRHWTTCIWRQQHFITAQNTCTKFCGLMQFIFTLLSLFSCQFLASCECRVKFQCMITTSQRRLPTLQEGEPRNALGDIDYTREDGCLQMKLTCQEHVPERKRRTDHRCAYATVDFIRDRRSDEVGHTWTRTNRSRQPGWRRRQLSCPSRSSSTRLLTFAWRGRDKSHSPSGDEKKQSRCLRFDSKTKVGGFQLYNREQTKREQTTQVQFQSVK